MQKGLKILAIETSADDTAVAIVDVKKSARKTEFKILGNGVASQTALHTGYGGIFPMIAKREHAKNIRPLYEKVMADAKNPDVDAIAVTVGPGLEPALWVGITFAEELEKLWGVPIIPVNHMEGHIFSVFPNKTKKFTVGNDKKTFPMLSLLVSGGHTELVLMKDFMKYEKIGQTRDDACGEAFDKVARMLGLPYPGGPEISRLANEERKNRSLMELAQARRRRAEQIREHANTRVQQTTNFSEVILPRPMIYSKDYDFSFSGLKTAVLYYIRDHGPLTEKIKSEIAKEFEDAAIEVLVAKTARAVEEFKIKTVIVGGGVSANTHLQKMLKKKLKETAPKVAVRFPTQKLTGDNALMIAIAGYFQYINKKYSRSLKANGNMQLH